MRPGSLPEKNLLQWRPYQVTIILSLVMLAPFLAWATVLALRSNTNDPRQWLPQGFPETASYDWFQDYFGNDEITIVSWPSNSVREDRADRLAQALISQAGEGYFERALSGRQIVRRMITPPLNIPPAEALERLRGFLIGVDGDTTCVFATVSQKGVENRADAVEQLKSVARETLGLQDSELKLGGPTVDAATIDIESQRLLLELAGFSALVALAISWWQLRSLVLTLILLFISVYCTALAMAVLYITGGSMNLVMTMLPPLVFVLSISASVHLVNYYRDAYLEGEPEEAPALALQHGWKPCGLASATTGLGLLSLAVSEIVPVKMFGVYSATGILLSLAVILIALPVALQIFLPTPRQTLARSSANTTQKSSEPGIDSDVIERLYTFIVRHHRFIVLGILSLMLVCGAGLFRLRSTVKLQYRFGRDSRIINDYRWLEDNLGPLVPMELVVRFPKGDDQKFLEELEQVSLVEEELRRIPEVGAALSGADFTPAISGGSSVRGIIERVMWKRRADEIQQQITRNRFLAIDEQGGRLWRISLRAPALGEIDYGRFVDALRGKVEPLRDSAPEMEVVYTGIIPLIYKAQRELLNDLTNSFLMAFCLIALVITLVLRSLLGGLTAMVPNIFPVVIIFGLMGWAGIYVEIGSMMTTSAAMGIAVDDTIHLLVWHRRSLATGAAREAAVHRSMQRCATAMFNTTLICACALLVFSFSSFMPIVRFAWLMAALLTTALVGDLLLLPAILVSPIGKIFANRLPATE